MLSSVHKFLSFISPWTKQWICYAHSTTITIKFKRCIFDRFCFEVFHEDLTIYLFIEDDDVDWLVVSCGYLGYCFFYRYARVGIWHILAGKYIVLFYRRLTNLLGVMLSIFFCRFSPSRWWVVLRYRVQHRSEIFWEHCHTFNFEPVSRFIVFIHNWYIAICNKYKFTLE